MDFFEHQDAARRRTSHLVWLFAAAVIAIIAAVYPVVAVAVTFMNRRGQQGPSPTLGEILWNPTMLISVTLGVIAVVALGSLYKLAQLRGGGRVIAEQLGGRLLDPSSTDATDRKILNVVEEMAIASGMPVPPVYLMDQEQAVNAFAAGFSPSDAVIGVTRGCVELLSRDELQGVMAHEFSHILNGDMKLNIRLIGILHGILIIGLLGTVLLRSAFWGSVMHGHSYQRRGKNEGGGAMAILGIGIALMVIGYLGVFFGNLIKSAISRQREFLADASAVQFTRYPDGIAGALKKIGGHSFGSKMLHPNAEESSHMFFGEGVSHWLGNAMATHPPLSQRIERIDPQWDGEFATVELPRSMRKRAKQKRQHLESRSPMVSSLASQMQQVQVDVTEAAPLIGQIGSPTPQHIAHAAALLQGLEKTVKSSARETFGARAVIYAMLLDRDAAMRDTQYRALKENADPQVYELTKQLTTAVSQIDPASRLLVIDLAIPALRELSQAQYEAFIKNVNILIQADKQVDLFEWTLRRIILLHLKPQFEKVRPPIVQYYNLRGVQDACATLLSVLAYVGHRERKPAFAAFKQAAVALAPIHVQPKPPDDCSLDTLGAALDQLNQLAPRPKRQVIEAAARCVAADHKVTIEEVELLRAICDTLDCPMPPLLPGQALV